MKNAYEVLRQKEAELDRVRKEIESLHIVASLFPEDSVSSDCIAETDELPTIPLYDTISRLSDSVVTNADNLFSSVAGPRPKFWDALKRAR